MKKRSKREGSIKVMVISEFPVDSIIGTSDRSNEAREGILEYIQHESPDAIFVDGLVSSIKDPEVLVPYVARHDEDEDRIMASLDLASEFLSELCEVAPNAEIYLAKTDADDYNVGQIEKVKASERKTKYEATGSIIEDKIKQLYKDLDNAKTAGERDKMRSIAGSIGAAKKKLNKMAKTGKYRQPKRGSPERLELMIEADEEYYGRLQAKNPAIQVMSEGRFQTEINGVLLEYVHNGHTTAAPLANRGTAAVDGVKKKIVNGDEVPSILIESGHHAELSVNPVRLQDTDGKSIDEYAMVVSAPVMEDQEMVAKIRAGKVKQLNNKAKNLEAVKRAGKKNPPTGIMMTGRDEKGFFMEAYSLNHLAKVGKGEVKLDDMSFSKTHVISDMHCGKETTRLSLMRNYLLEIRDGIREAVKNGTPVPALFFLNEALQGYNYSSYPVEFVRQTPDQVREHYTDVVEKLMESGAIPEGKKLEALVEEMVRGHEGISMVRIEDQWKLYNEIFMPTIIHALACSDVYPAAIFCEGNHVTSSVGDKGVTETGLQTEPIREFDRAINVLKEIGKIPNDVEMESLYDKLLVFQEGMISSYGKFQYTVGETQHLFVVEHKPGGGSARTNVVKRRIQRSQNRGDMYDVYLSGHTHYMVAGAEGAGNDLLFIGNGGTFSEHDSYGKSGEWAPPTIGALEVELPYTLDEETSNEVKGVAKFRFKLSDVLED